MKIEYGVSGRRIMSVYLEKEDKSVPYMRGKYGEPTVRYWRNDSKLKAMEWWIKGNKVGTVKLRKTLENLA